MGREVAEHLFVTERFQREVIPGSVHPSDEPGLPGRIEFKASPEEDKDKNNDLATWLGDNTVHIPQRSSYKVKSNWWEETIVYTYFDGKNLCSVSVFEKGKRDRRSDTDPLKYQKFAVIRVQPCSEVPYVLRETLETCGYTQSSKSLLELLKNYQ